MGERFQPVPKDAAAFSLEPAQPLPESATPPVATNGNGIVSEREAFNAQWNRDKIERRRHNEQLRHNIYDHGTFFINGVGQPKKKGTIYGR